MGRPAVKHDRYFGMPGRNEQDQFNPPIQEPRGPVTGKKRQAHASVQS